MRRISMYFLGLTIIAMAIGFNAGAQDKPPEKAATAPGTAATGPKAEFLEEIAYYEQRYVRLAESVPAEKYAWKPAEGVRSIGEVYTHIVAANYGVARALGTQPQVQLVKRVRGAGVAAESQHGSGHRAGQDQTDACVDQE